LRAPSRFVPYPVICASALSDSRLAENGVQFELIPGIGGVPKLRAWAEREPTEFYKLWAKLLPTQLVGGDPGSDPIRQRIEQVIVDPKAES
jgi:hypothetical protein